MSHPVNSAKILIFLNSDLGQIGLRKFLLIYILVQQSTTVSLTGLPVLRTLYKPMSINKSTNGKICELFVL